MELPVISNTHPRALFLSLFMFSLIILEVLGGELLPECRRGILRPRHSLLMHVYTTPRETKAISYISQMQGHNFCWEEKHYLTTINKEPLPPKQQQQKFIMHHVINSILRIADKCPEQ